MTTPLPPTLLRVSIVPSSDSQISVLWNALAKLSSELGEDPTLKVTSDGVTGETQLEGTGHLHLEIYLERLRGLGCEFSVGLFHVIEKSRTSSSGTVKQQPIMRVEIQTSKSKQETIRQFIAYHRGKVMEIRDVDLDASSEAPDDIVVIAEIPLNELETFPAELTKISKISNFAYEFLEYRDIPS